MFFAIRRLFAVSVCCCLAVPLFSQEVCWVFFRDKSGCSFDPYAYFDAKAIERRISQGIPLCDSTDYPLNAAYAEAVGRISLEVVGESRWLNALAVVADAESLEAMRHFSFVSRVVPIQREMQPCAMDGPEAEFVMPVGPEGSGEIHQQLKYMGGDLFVRAGMRGKGMRIAVLETGFSMVDRHEAFRHLRESGRIVKTYNFPEKCENVYGWGSHGTMTLGCIGGWDATNRCAIGLATEAEFLLARTEVGPEPKKEEVWWVMGLEWAERNGANIVNSSLGYNETNHWPTEADGTSPISRAANMAAAKGILVCNSAGNDNGKIRWPGIILPADADSVLTVGGINPENNWHADFSSCGPTADGRLKPNVCAYACYCRVASCASPQKYTYSDGTSFSSPLVAGFAACAWQSHPEYGAMQLKEAIEHSANLYPYYDYAVGYGVPQAAFFVGGGKVAVQPTFRILRNEKGIFLSLSAYEKGDVVYYHFRRADGRIVYYRQICLDFAFPGYYFVNYSDAMQCDTLCVHYKGYTVSVAPKDLPLEPLDTANLGLIRAMEGESHRNRDVTFAGVKVHFPNVAKSRYKSIVDYRMKDSSGRFTAWGRKCRQYVGVYAGCGVTLPVGTLPRGEYRFSPNWQAGLFYQYNISKFCASGLGLGVGGSKAMLYPDGNKVNCAGLQSFHLDVEYFQRFRLYPNISLDAGVIGAWNFSNSWISKTKEMIITDLEGKEVSKNWLVVKTGAENVEPFAFSALLRLNYRFFSIYGQYLFTDRMGDGSPLWDATNRIRLSIGLQLRY